MIEKQPRIALLIDADNAPASKIEFIMSELASHGVVNIRRAYGNWKKRSLAGWETVLHENAIQPVQHFDLVKGKNATDMALLIEAMDILYTKDVDTFCLVSSDCDFTPLVLRLRADGKQVIGFGGQNTPEPFINGCTRFLYLESLVHGGVMADAEANKMGAPKSARKPALAKGDAGEAAEPAPTRLDTAALKQDARLVTLLRNAVESAAGEDGWSALGSVGQQIGNQASFDPRNYGYRKLLDLIEATQLFELDRRGSQVLLRDRRLAKAARV